MAFFRAASCRRFSYVAGGGVGGGGGLRKKPAMSYPVNEKRKSKIYTISGKNRSCCLSGDRGNVLD